MKDSRERTTNSWLATTNAAPIGASPTASRYQQGRTNAALEFRSPRDNSPVPLLCTPAGVRVPAALTVRDCAPPDDPRSAVLARLRELDATGGIDDVTVRVWGKRVAPPSDGTDGRDSRVQERVAEFLSWAERNGHSLEPAFRRCERSTMVSEERREAIRRPLQSLAVYEDGRLVGVFPCSTVDGTNTVSDCVRRLESGDVGAEPSPE